MEGDPLSLFRLTEVLHASPPSYAEAAAPGSLGTWHAAPSRLSYAVSLEGCPRAVATSLSPQRLRRDVPTVLHAAVAARDGEAYAALFHTGGGLRLSRTRLRVSAAAGGGIAAENADAAVDIPWPQAAALAVTCIAFSDNARAIALGTAGGEVFVGCVDTLFCGGGAGFFTGLTTMEGIISLAGLAGAGAGVGVSKSGQGFVAAVRIPVAKQLGATEIRAAVREAPTCLAWWTPVAVVMNAEAARVKAVAAAEKTPIANVGGEGGPAAFASSIAGRFLVIGHSSGRITFVDVSARSIVFSAVIDTVPITDLQVYGDAAAMLAHGLWEPFSSGPVVTPTTTSTSSTLAAEAVALDWPALPRIPDSVSLLIRTDRAFFRCLLERASPDPHAERIRVATRLVAVNEKETAAVAANNNSAAGSRDLGGGHLLRIRRRYAGTIESVHSL